MYKFLASHMDQNEEKWLYCLNNKMYPTWSPSTKESILVGYYSKDQRKWITSGTAIQVRSNYQNVRKAMPDTELTLIMLSLNVAELSNNKFSPFESKFESIYFRDFLS